MMLGAIILERLDTKGIKKSSGDSTRCLQLDLKIIQGISQTISATCPPFTNPIPVVTIVQYKTDSRY
jgi:hypothetical protein